MDVVRLGPRYSTSYQPDELIEGYSSMIWTERNVTDGEFELKTPHIAETLALLPEDTFISHLETDDVHIVENHAISEDDEGNQELTVTGRSLTSFLDNRFVEGTYQKKRKMGRTYSPASAACVLLWNAVNNSSGKDVSYATDVAMTLLDELPNVVVTDSSPVNTSTKRWWLTEGGMYPQLLDILDAGDLGVRVIRPNAGSDATVASVKVMPLSARGTVARTYTSNIMALRYDIYKGVDRSHNQSVNDKVGFSKLQGHINKSNYLFSYKDYMTAFEIMSSAKIGDVYRNDTEKAYSGWQRRVMAWDAGTPEDGETVAEFKDDAIVDARRALARGHRKTRLFSGDISPFSPFKYREHYNLGDTVTLFGDYGLVETMVVNEYIRTEDATGDRGLPGLAAWPREGGP